MAALAHGQQLGRLSSQQLLLLHWLLTEPRRPVAHITRASLEDVRRSLPSLKGEWPTRAKGKGIVARKAGPVRTHVATSAQRAPPGAVGDWAHPRSA